MTYFDAFSHLADDGLQTSTMRMPMQVHELRKEGDAERLVRAAFDAATLSPAEKTIHTFVAVGGDHTANTGTLQSRCAASLSRAYHHELLLLNTTQRCAGLATRTSLCRTAVIR